MLVCKYNRTKPCGKCQACRILSHVDLVKRLQIQWQLMPFAYFVTLTYDNECIPRFSNGLNTLFKGDLTLFLKLCKKYLPKHVVFAVGEYGGKLFIDDPIEASKAERDINPHYHLIFYFSTIADSKLKEIIQKYWYFGRSQTLNCSQSLISYIAGYVTKKLTNKKSMKDFKNLDILPEFSRYPRNPALGDMSEQYLQIWETYGLQDKIILNGKSVTLPKPLLKTLIRKVGKDEIKHEFQKIRLEKNEQKIKEIMQLQKMSYSEALHFLNSQVRKQQKRNSDSKLKLRFNKRESI